MKAAHVQKTYGSKEALRVEGLCFPTGQITAVIGANGSGKSTLLKVLAGAEPADAPFVREPEAWPGAGYMPQKSWGFKMSVDRNVLVGLPATAENRLQAEALMKALGMETFRRTRGDRLSGGETQKLALVRVLMRPRGLLLLDEPTAALDAASIVAAEELIQAYCKRNAATVVMVTHSVKQALRISQWVAVMDDGRVAEQGETELVLWHPRTETARRILELG